MEGDRGDDNDDNDDDDDDDDRNDDDNDNENADNDEDGDEDDDDDDNDDDVNDGTRFHDSFELPRVNTECKEVEDVEGDEEEEKRGKVDFGLSLVMEMAKSLANTPQVRGVTMGTRL